MIVNTPQALQQLTANLQNMADDDIKKVQIHIEGQLVFPNLAVARPPKDNPEGRKTYGAVLIFPMGQLSQINQIGMNAIHSITEVFKARYHAQVPKHNYIRCYKNIQESPTQDGGNPHPEFYQGSHWVNTNSGEDHKPKIFKKINNVLTEVDAKDADLYFGQKVVFVVTLYPMGINPKKPTARKGTGANIVGVLILGGGERLGGGSAPVTLDVNASFNAFASMTADFKDGASNPFASADQSNQGQASSNPFGGGQSQGNGYPGSHQNTANGANNGTNQQAAGAPNVGASHSSNPFANSNVGAPTNNSNNGGNPFGGGLI